MSTLQKIGLIAGIIFVGLCCLCTSPLWIPPAKDRMQDWNQARETAVAYQPPASQAPVQPQVPPEQPAVQPVAQATAELPVSGSATQAAPETEKAWSATVIFQYVKDGETKTDTYKLNGRTEFHQLSNAPWACSFTVYSNADMKMDADFTADVTASGTTSHYKFSEPIQIKAGTVYTVTIVHQDNCSFALQDPIDK